VLWFKGTHVWHLDHIVAQKTCYGLTVRTGAYFDVPREEQVPEVTPTPLSWSCDKRMPRRKAALIAAMRGGEMRVVGHHLLCSWVACRRGRNLGRIK
jgi:hypothetical protein